MLVLIIILFHFGYCMGRSSLFGEQGNEDDIITNLNHAYERHYQEDPLCLQLEPFKPAWSQNPSYYKVNEGEVAPMSNWVSIQS